MKDKTAQLLRAAKKLIRARGTEGEKKIDWDLLVTNPPAFFASLPPPPPRPESIESRLARYEAQLKAGDPSTHSPSGFVSVLPPVGDPT